MGLNKSTLWALAISLATIAVVNRVTTLKGLVLPNP